MATLIKGELENKLISVLVDKDGRVVTTGKHYVKMCFNCGDRFIEEKQEQPKKRRWFK